jgi:hypothetical protein
VRRKEDGRMEEFGGGRRRRARSVACRGAARIDLMGGSTHNGARAVGPKWVHGWVDAGWMKKNYVLGRSAPQIVIFIIVPTFWSSYNLTGGSDVRGKVGPN